MTLKFVTLALLAMLVVPAHAAGPGKGEMTSYSTAGLSRAIKDSEGGTALVCETDSLTARWNLTSVFGKPRITGSWIWWTSETREGCQDLPTDPAYILWIHIAEYTKDENGEDKYIHGFIPIEPRPPVAGQYSEIHSYTPDWNKAIVKEVPTIGLEFEFWEEEDAKRLWKNASVGAFFIKKPFVARRTGEILD